MWAWLIGGYAAVLLVLTGFAGFVASSVDNARTRADAYKVLKLVLTAVTGASGLLAAALTLQQAGLL